MKVNVALLLITTFVSALFGGKVFFAPTSDAAPTAPAAMAATDVFVIDHDGDPVEKAIITTSAEDANGVSTTVQTLTTNSEGKVRPHFPKSTASNGTTYAIHATLPDDFNSRMDTDEGVGHAPCTGDQMLCITVVVRATDVSLVGSQAPASKLQFDVDATKPQPRADIHTKDSSGNVVKGGVVMVLDADDNEVWSGPNPDGTTLSKLLKKGEYRVAWKTLPKNHKASPSQDDRLQTVKEKKVFELFADPIAQAPEDTSSMAVTEDIEYSAGPTEIEAAPEEEAATVAERVATPTTPDEPAADPVFEEIEVVEAPAAVEEVPAPVEEIEVVEVPAPVEEIEVVEAPAPVEEIEVVEAPAPAEEVPAPVEEAPAPAADEPVDAGTADCFMYLEMYPELTEIDPGLPSYCEFDNAAARALISELLIELGL